jgi:hypothetical protein
MSRAFIKEGDAPEPRCPSCGTQGEAVGPATLDAQLSPADRKALGDRAYYCANPGCSTAYFSAWDAVIPQNRLKSRAWPKDPQAPICPCFGLSAADVIADARAGRKNRVLEIREEADAPDARCPGLAPDGRSCMTSVMRLFRENFQAP